MQEVYRQLFCLLIFAITGALIGALFDIFRILRRSFKTADWLTYLQDIIFWILAGCIMLFSIFIFNNGQIRSYVFIGMLLGIILYMIAISKIFVKFSVTIIKFIKKILSYPINLIKNILLKLIKPILKLLEKTKKHLQNLPNKTNKKTSSNETIRNSNKIFHFLTKDNKKTKEKEGILKIM